ncbi:MAG: DEAD/DEAH box helicase, partial [Acidobacterium ailaaui]|nr:DEAD/DEAH box helicase [Pseudacidobacterium ailaaui]
MQRQEPEDILHLFHPVTAEWFRTALGTPTAPQRMGWPAIARGESTLILAPTGTGKTLAAFLWCLDQLMLSGKASGQQISDFTQQDAMKVQHKPTPALSSGMRKLRSQEGAGCRILYVSPLKALAVDVERNLRVPLAGIAETARRRDVAFHRPEISVRTGDTPQKERARFRRHPAEILITTP